MCGFAGYISFNNTKISQTLLELMGNSLSHRGPDEQNIFQDDNLSFVFRRLSIVDIDGGSQPIWNSDNSVFVAVNGEIYNHIELRDQLDSSTILKTNSDSEIILHLYLKFGTQAFEKLNGMFSIIIWDTRTKELIIARDRLGIKPLYYSILDDGIIFSSELKALLLHPSCPKEIKWSDINKAGLQDCDNVATFVEGVNHFPAGHFVKLSEHKQFKAVCYWNIDDYLSLDNNIDPLIIEKQYFELIDDSIKKRLMSDVPIGIFLSGGIDSSLLTSLASKYTKNIHCFTVVDESTYNSGDVEQARIITESLGLAFYPILFNLQDMINRFDLKALEKMVYLIESPRFDLEWYYKSELHKAAKNQVPDLKVIILGQGADEFCGGYSKYLGSNWKNWEEYISNEVEPSVIRNLQQNQKIPERFIQSNQDSQKNNYKYSSCYKQKMANHVNQLQFFNLWHEDRSSSFYGIESRVPFLDHRIVELMASISSDLHNDLFWNKRILRNITKKQIPDYPDSHPKVPFFVTDDLTPINSFAKQACKIIYPQFVSQYCDCKIFNPASLKDTYEQSQKNNKASATAAWQLLELMCISIFNRFCHDTEDFINKQEHSLTEAYPLIDMNTWSELPETLSKNSLNTKMKEWQLESKINIPTDCEILNPLSETEGSTNLILMHNQQQQLQINIPESHDWIVMLLDAIGRKKDSPENIDYWIKKLNITTQEFINVVSDLVHGGFLVRC